MPICRRSTHRLALLTALLLPGSGRCDPPPVQPLDQAGILPEIGRLGPQALDRLRWSLDQARDSHGIEVQLSKPNPQPAQVDTLRKTIKDRTGDAPMADRAKRAAATARQGLAAQSETMSRRLGAALGLSAPDIVAMAGVAAPDAHLRWVPLLFASSSMPIDELRTYAAGLEKTGGALGFRGMPGGLHAVAPMAALSARILRLDPGCEGPACTMRKVPIIIDPIAFRSFGIDRVPALAMVPGDPTQAYCERAKDAPVSSLTVYGDASLSGQLEELARLGAKMEVSDAQARLLAR